MEVFYGFLSATAGVVVGGFLALLVLFFGSVAAIVGFAWVVGRIRGKRTNIVKFRKRK